MQAKEVEQLDLSIPATERLATIQSAAQNPIPYSGIGRMAGHKGPVSSESPGRMDSPYLRPVGSGPFPISSLGQLSSPSPGRSPVTFGQVYHPGGLYPLPTAPVFSSDPPNVNSK